MIITWFAAFIIACCAGVVVAVASGFIGHAVGNSHVEQAIALKDAEHELRTKQHKVRESAVSLAERTAEHVETLARQSEKRSKHVKKAAVRLKQSAEKLNQVVEEAPKTALVLRSTSRGVTEALTEPLRELEVTRKELVSVNKVLKKTQRKLHQKDQALERVLKQLENTEHAFNNQQEESQATFSELKRQLDEARTLLAQAKPQVLDTERELSARDLSQAQAFQVLVSENMALKEEIKNLIGHITGQVEQVESSDNSQHLRLFS